MCVKCLKNKPHKDLNTVIHVLEEDSVFIPTRKRQHTSFKFETGLMAKLSINELKRKIPKTLISIETVLAITFLCT